MCVLVCDYVHVECMCVHDMCVRVYDVVCLYVCVWCAPHMRMSAPAKMRSSQRDSIFSFLFSVTATICEGTPIGVGCFM